MLKVDKRLFEYETVTMNELLGIQATTVKRIYLPLHSTPNNPVYLEVTFNNDKSQYDDPAKPYEGLRAEHVVYDYVLKGTGNEITGEIVCGSIGIPTELVFKDFKKWETSDTCIVTGLPEAFAVGMEFDSSYLERIYFSQHYTSQNVNFVETIILLDSDYDDKWDTLVLKNGPDKRIVFSDIDDTGNYKFAGKTDCRIEAVIADFGGLGVPAKADTEKENYCVRHLSKSEAITYLGARVLGAAAIVGSGFFTGGLSWTVLIAGAALEVGGELVFKEYKQTWPG